MISVQPIHLWHYLTFKPAKFPFGVKRLFYLSWEDALWDITDKKNILKGSTVLVPEFFCGDVEQNIRNHGYKIAYYKTDLNLTSDKNSFKKQVLKTHPSVIIIFHVVGITNNLFLDLSWLKIIPEKTILVEDCVHRIISPEKIRFLKNNHFLMDSLRKNVPLQGSNVFGKKEDLNFSEPAVTQSWLYALKVTVLWIIMNILWNLGLSFKAEAVMKEGYGVIGDSQLPSSGWPIFKYLYTIFNFKKIKKVKTHQVEIYENYLAKILPVNIPYLASDKGELRAWPIVFKNIKQANNVLEYLRKNGLVVRFELIDSVWSTKYRVIYLPLGLHLNDRQIIEVCNLVKKAFLP